MHKNASLFIVVLGSALMAVTGCKSVYYSTMESVGIPKRDIMVDRVEGAQKAVRGAQVQFTSALDAFTAVVEFDGGELEKVYKRLDGELQRSQKKADEVNDRIAKVESVSKALFKEWKSELKQYSDASMRRASEQQLKATEAQYNQMISKMKSAAASMEPVLKVFSDQVLFLKHNLNSQAIASVRKEADRVEADVSKLIREMEASIAEADAFIQQMGT